MKKAAMPLSALCLALCLCLLATPLLAAERGAGGPLMVLGQAPAGANEAQAREAATQDALRRAVGQAALEMLDPQVARAKLDILEREVLAKATHFVANYSLQGSWRGPEGSLALVSVSVDRPALDKALSAGGLRQAPISLPLVLALVSEEPGPGRPAAFWWGDSGQESLPAPLTRAFKGAGLRLVDTRALLGRVPAELKQAVLSEEQALTLARQCGAGLVILGRLRTYPLVSPGGDSSQPMAQLEALDVASGQVVGTEEAEGPVFSASPGPEAADKVFQAGEDAVRRLLQQAAKAKAAPAASAAPVSPSPAPAYTPAPTQAPVASYTPPASPASGAGMASASAPAGDDAGSVQLELTGLRSLGDLHRFTTVLQGMSGVVAQVRRESVGAGKASLRLKLLAPASRLADDLVLQNFGDYAVAVLDTSPQRLRVAIVPK